MRILKKSFRRHVESSCLEETVTFYERLEGVTCERRIRIEQAGIDIALVGDFIILAGPEAVISQLRGVQATFTVDSLDEFVAALPAQGAELMSPPKSSAAGRNATVRHPDGLVVEYYEKNSPQ